MRFDYTRVRDPFLPNGSSYLPLVDVNIGKHRIPLKCLIDSGSPVIILHSPIGVAAGIIPADGRKSSLMGIGSGTIEGYYHTIEMNFYGIDFTGTVFFYADLDTPFGLLGQLGFFENFRVDFRLSHRYFDIHPVK